MIERRRYPRHVIAAPIFAVLAVAGAGLLILAVMSLHAWRWLWRTQ